MYKIISCQRDNADKKVKWVVYPDKEAKKQHQQKHTYKIAVCEKLPKDNDDAHVVGWLSDKYAVSCGDDFAMQMDTYVYAWLNNKKPKLSKTLGYLQVGADEYIGLARSYRLLLPFLWFLAALLLVLAIMFLWKDDIKKFINDNLIGINDIVPTDINTPDPGMAYISGESVTTVNASQKNVYLKNDKENDHYYLKYRVYLKDSDKLLYETGLIKADYAEPWNAYDCEDLVMGDNMMHYEVEVYDLEQELVAKSNLDGLKVRKE